MAAATAAIRSAPRRPRTTFPRCPQTGSPTTYPTAVSAITAPIASGEKPRRASITVTNGMMTPIRTPTTR